MYKLLNTGNLSMNFKQFLLSIFLLTFSFASFSQNIPEKPNKLINDYTNTLSVDEINRLEQKLVAFNDSTSTQIAVVLVKSLEGYEISDYSVKLYEKWGIGGAKKNNGVLLLASLGDRKIFITTGYGVEGVLPDAIAKRIIENEITPNFKSGNYFEGLDAGTNAIISYTKGEYKSDTKGDSGIGGFWTSILTFWILFFIFIIVIVLLSIFGKGGGGNRVIGSRGIGSTFGGFGGFDSGGFSGGGGGGFSGFGGGSTGGGGAGGSW